MSGNPGTVKSSGREPSRDDTTLRSSRVAVEVDSCEEPQLLESRMVEVEAELVLVVVVVGRSEGEGGSVDDGG